MFSLQASTSYDPLWSTHFQLPNMPYAVERCLEKKEMTVHATNKMVEYIGDKMYGTCRYPTKEDYKTVARKIVNEYPFLKDKIGSGYVSTLCTVFFSFR